MSEPNKDIIDEAIEKIEAALQIKLEEENKENQTGNTYKSYDRRKINTLTLSNLSFDNFDALEPVFKMVNWMRFINCTINDISALVHLHKVNYLTLDGVKIDNVYKTDSDIVNTSYGHFETVELKNMRIEHLSFLLPLSNHLEYLHLTNCEIHNFYEVNLLPKLYSLSLTEVKIHHTPTDVYYKAFPNSRLIFLNFKDMKIEDFDLFLAISEKIENIDIENSLVSSLYGLHQFPQFEILKIDAATIVETIETPRGNTMASFQLKECIIIPTKIEEEEEEIKTDKETVFDIQKLASIAPNIKSLRFNIEQLNNTEFLKEFTQLETLEFEKCNVDLNDFISVSHQINRLFLDECLFKNTKSLSNFTQLNNIEIHDGYDKNGQKIKAVKNLKRLLPLKHQLKKLRLWEADVEGLENIEAFTALESLELYEVSIKTAELIFSLPNLKRLSIDIANKTATSFNLKGIKNIEWLVINCDNKITIEGLKDLDQLERLELESGPCQINHLHHLKKLKHFTCKTPFNINQVSTMQTLKTLELDIDKAYEINGLQQFPNLENLSIQGGHTNIKLGKLEKLKVLDMEGGGSTDKINFLKELPNLEKLDLGFRVDEEIPDLSHLPNLKMLNLAENSNIKNIEGLKPLKKLEYLNLYANKISDIRVLNSLPKLKEVNIAANLINRKEVKNQLDKPEIAVFLGLPRVPFIIWRKDHFEL